MMSPDDIPAKLVPPPPPRDHHQQQQGSASRKPGSGGGTGGRPAPQEQGLKCPRCDSPNTKFCYYNNYSLTQPRHFCKTCRRYWTKGGALRNVPIGGGCRKNKKVRSSRLTSSASSCDSGSSNSDHHLSGLKFLHGLAAAASPSLDFHLGGLPFPPRLHHHHQPPAVPVFNNSSSSSSSQFPNSFGEVSGITTPDNPSGGPQSSMIGLNYPFCPSPGLGGGGASAIIQGMSSMNVHGSLASSIESLSSMNQDLHWKLQQQRLAMLFGGGDGEKEIGVDHDHDSSHHHQQQKRQPILFQSLEKEGAAPAGGPPTEWFFGNPGYPSSVAPTPTSGATSNWGGGGGRGEGGAHAWGDVHHQYSALP